MKYPPSASPIPVCFVLDRLVRAGTELLVLRLIAGIDRRRFSPSLVLLDDADSAALLAGVDCPVLRLDLPRLRHPRLLPAALRLAAFLRRRRVAVLQLHHPIPTGVGVAAAFFAPRARLLRTRFSLGYWVGTPGARRFERLTGRLCDVTVANCDAARRALLAEGPEPRGGIAVIANGIETDRLAALGPWTPRQRQRIGLLANLRAVKDPALLVKAAALLAPRFPRATFEIAGEGDLRAELVALAASRGLGSRFRLRGEVTDPAEFLGEIDVAVLCSRSEALPNALLEYMAAGRPIVATAVGGVPEAVRDGREGLLVPAGDELQLAAAIAKLLDDSALAQRLAAAARERCLATYPMSATLARFSRLYERLAQRPGPPLRRSLRAARGRALSDAEAIPQLDGADGDRVPVEA